MDTHYVCTGDCNGVSPIPGTCQTETCEKHAEALKECNCQDGTHEEAKTIEGEQAA